MAIARAFLADAPILILDEAPSSLDTESEVLIQNAMERLMVGRTTLIIAHRLWTVRALDRLLVFDRGRIIEEGDHAALIRLNSGIYRRLFERQRWSGGGRSWFEADPLLRSTGSGFLSGTATVRSSQ